MVWTCEMEIDRGHLEALSSFQRRC